MKKLLFFTVISLLSLVGQGGISLFAQGRVVQTRSLSANYSATPPTITFEVYWLTPPTGPMHRDTVWVFVDYAPIVGNAPGAWGPASLTGATVTAGTGTIVPASLNGRGFYLAGNPSGAFSSTLTVTLSADLNNTKFNWCAYATDYPPNATEDDGHYNLYGTPPFVVNGTYTATTREYDGGCIDDLTDATGCPGWPPVAPAVLSFDASVSTLCAGGSVTLTATATGAASYSFNNGASWVANTSGTASTAVTPAHDTVYTVHIQNRAGCTATFAPASVTVYPLPAATFSTAPSTACAGSPITIIASGGGAGGSYCFTRSCDACIRNPYVAGNNASGAADCDIYAPACTYSPSNTYTLTMPENGSVTVWVKVVNQYGCVDSTSTVIEAIPCAASISLPLGNANQSLCEGEAINTLTYATIGVAHVSYSGLPAGLATVWGDNDITISGTPTVTGSFPYTVTVTGLSGSAEASGTITINPLPTISSANSPGICNGEAATLTVTGGAGTYSWTIGGTPAQTTTTGSYTAAALTATATYSVTLRDANGCTSAAATGTITENPPPTLSSANSPSICSGQTARLTVTGGAGTYSWTVGNNAAQTTTTASYTTTALTATTTYSVTLSDENGCTSATATGTITVNTGVARATISGNNANTCPTATVVLTAEATGATSYTWRRATTSVQTGTSNQYTVSENGNYTVIASNSNCTATASVAKTVTITDCRTVPGCSGLRVYQATATTDGQASWSVANAWCNSHGARLPSITELKCLCSYNGTQPVGLLDGDFTSNAYYWSTAVYNSSNGSYYAILSISSCGQVAKAGNAYFRCVL